MNVLVACEESQRVCAEFRKRGHTAFSCDLADPSGGVFEWHRQAEAGQVYGKEKSAKHRSKTFPGIARAMAEQWGIL